MRDYGTAIETHLASGAGLQVRHLVWIEAINRDTGLVDPGGFWNGYDARVFSVGGEDRTYQGAGTLLEIAPIIGEVGIRVRMQRVSLSKIPPSVVNLINGYEVRFAPIEVHRVFFDPVKGVQIGDPVRVLKGTVDEMPVPTPAEGGTATVDLTVASAARALTRTLTAKKSDADQRRIDANDKGREYSAIVGVPVFWGQKQAATKPGSAAPPAAPPLTPGDRQK